MTHEPSFDGPRHPHPTTLRVCSGTSEERRAWAHPTILGPAQSLVQVSPSGARKAGYAQCPNVKKIPTITYDLPDRSAGTPDPESLRRGGVCPIICEWTRHVQLFSEMTEEYHRALAAPSALQGPSSQAPGVRCGRPPDQRPGEHSQLVAGLAPADREL